MKFNFKFSINKTYKHNGVEYKSLDEMPDDVRRLYQQAQEQDAAAPITAPEAEPDTDEEFVEGLENLLEKPSAGNAETDSDTLVKTDKTSDGLWYAGTAVIAALLLFLGYKLGVITFRSGKYLSLPALVDAACVISGFGLLARQKWAWLLALALLPAIALAMVYGIMLKAGGDFSRLGPLQITLYLSLLAFAYLLLPWVSRQFTYTATAKNLRREMRLLNLVPPPRAVPLSLKLSMIFGNPVILACCWPLLAMVTVSPLLKLKAALGGFGYEPSLPFAVQAVKYGVPLLLLAIVAGVTAFILKHGSKEPDILRDRVQSSGKLIKKARIKFGKHSLYRLIFEYEAGGKKFKTWVDMPLTGRLEDEAKEPLLYDPKKPKDAVLLDALPAHIAVTGAGELEHRFAFMGYIYALLPVMLFGALIYIIVS